MAEAKELLEKYNYPDFTPDYFQPWIRFEESPRLGEATDDFTLVELSGG